MDIEQAKILEPTAIETKSMEIIAAYLQGIELSSKSKAIYQRVIHTTGDPSIAQSLRLSPDFAERAVRVLQSGADIWTDVEMIRTGVNKKSLALCGGGIHCAIQDEDVAAVASADQVTRASTAVLLRADQLEGAVYAVGNAPTALFALLRLILANDLRPAALIAVPVGFVGAAESKRLLVEQAAELEKRQIPWITLDGTRGGSTIAAAIINALLLLAGRG